MIKKWNIGGKDMKTHEKLVCTYTGEEFYDDGLILTNPNSDVKALLRTVYLNKKLRIRDDLPGIYKFAEWLPIYKILDGSSAPVTYLSEGLSKELGLKRLYITFSGYRPEIGAQMDTGTFKECEAYSVCARFPENTGKVLVVASAGNTARAFAKVCSENHIPLLVVIPESNLDNLWFLKEINPNVKLVAAGGNSDYFDAINLSNLICKLDGFIPEGGALNVARRDGMGTTVLSAVTTIGEIPDYYFQAVGSGTGAIAAWEANLRFIQSGEHTRKMKLIVSQNAPFQPLYDSWKAGSRELIIPDDETVHKLMKEIKAKMLSNRRPPYGIIGGLYDALKDTNGDVMAITNQELEQAEALFESTEKYDIAPDAAVAVASLIKKLELGGLDPNAIIMLNITGGGIKRLHSENKLYYMKPDLVIDKKDFTLEAITEQIQNLF